MANMNQQKSLKISVLSNWTSLAVNVIIGFTITPVIINAVGKQGYGVWTLICSIVGYYGLLNFGVGNAIVRYIARFTAQNDKNKLNQTASTSLSLFCLTGFIAAVLSFVLADALPDFFSIAPENRSDFIWLIKIFGLAVAIGFPNSALFSFFTAREHYIALNYVKILKALLRATMILIMLPMGKGLPALGLAHLTTSIVEFIIYIFLYSRYTSDIVLSVRNIDKGIFRMLLAYGSSAFVISIADILRINIDSLVIGKFMTMKDVGIYGVAAVILGNMVAIAGSMMNVLIPRFSLIDGAKEPDKLKELFLRSLGISASLAFGMSFFAICFGPRFIEIWVGSGYETAGQVLIIISTAYAFALAQAPGIGIMYAINRHNYYAFYTMLEAIANITLSIILVNKYGIIGVALGTAIPMMIVKCFIMPFYVSRILQIRITDYLRQFFCPAAIAALYAAVFIGLDHYQNISQSSRYFYFSTMGILLLLYLLLSYKIYFSGNKNLQNQADSEN